MFSGINTDNSGDVYAGPNSNLAYDGMNTLTAANLLWSTYIIRGGTHGPELIINLRCIYIACILCRGTHVLPIGQKCMLPASFSAGNSSGENWFQRDPLHCKMNCLVLTASFSNQFFCIIANFIAKYIRP